MIQSDFWFNEKLKVRISETGLGFVKKSICFSEMLLIEFIEAWQMFNTAQIESEQIDVSEIERQTFKFPEL